MRPRLGAPIVALLLAVWFLPAVAQASPPQCFGKNATIVSNKQTIMGTAGNDVIVAGSGGNWIDGMGGNDRICGGGGNDTIVSQSGDDLISGGKGSDWIDYSPADGSSAAGPVTVDLSAGTATGNGTDQLTGIENVWGSPYADTITGSSKENYLVGEAGDDTISAGGGFDFVDGGGGNDALDGGPGMNFVEYMLESASVNVNLAAGTATGSSAGSDTLSGFQGVIGSPYDDTLTGDGASNFFVGDTPAIWPSPGPPVAGNDTIDGAGGTDFVLYLFAAQPVAADLSKGMAIGEGADTLTSIEGLYGSQYGDTFDGSAGPDILFGGGGSDTLLGHDGADYLDGGTGWDTLDGGSGTDGCVFGEKYLNCENAQIQPTPVTEVLKGFRKKGFRKK